ncbi:MAG TPA: CBS domain-containing protein [Terriglobia bacterium]|nr:CBS domain-containing protein [Terriglobia bacterium]
MKIREIMTTNVECVSPETSITDLSQKMKTLDVGFLGVCENDRLVGTVTDRDIVIRGIASERDINSVTAREIMTHDVFWCYADDDVKDVAEKMREKDVRRMLILNRDKRLVGVVSIGDIAKVEEGESGKTLRDISEAA